MEKEVDYLMKSTREPNKFENYLVEKKLKDVALLRHTKYCTLLKLFGDNKTDEEKKILVGRLLNVLTSGGYSIIKTYRHVLNPSVSFSFKIGGKPKKYENVIFGSSNSMEWYDVISLIKLDKNEKITNKGKFVHTYMYDMTHKYMSKYKKLILVIYQFERMWPRILNLVTELFKIDMRDLLKTKPPKNALKIVRNGAYRVTKRKRDDHINEQNKKIRLGYTIKVSNENFYHYYKHWRECFKKKISESICYICKTQKPSEGLISCTEKECRRSYHSSCYLTCPVHWCLKCAEIGKGSRSVWECIFCGIGYCKTHFTSSTCDCCDDCNNILKKYYLIERKSDN